MSSEFFSMHCIVSVGRGAAACTNVQFLFYHENEAINSDKPSDNYPPYRNVLGPFSISVLERAQKLS